MNDNRLSKTRLFFIFFFFVAVLACLLARLGFIQIFKSNAYLSIAQNQSQSTIQMQPVRGRVLDRFGRELALDVRLDSLYVNAREIKKKSFVAKSLSKILGIEEAFLLDRLSRDKMFVWIARKISSTKAAAIKRLKINELGFLKESQRVYPKGETACHIIGFTDIDNNGLEGIELQYNSYLKGVPGWRLAYKDAKQRELISKEVEMAPPIDGYNIHLTIDEVIQSLTEKELAFTCQKFNASSGSIIVLEPKTGDILALANYPLYDLNNYRKADMESRRNRAITDIFEPGSVFKIFTLCSILENKVFGLDEKFDCENGSWAVAGRVLHDHHGSGILTFREVIEKSSNIGTVKGALRLGGDRLYKTIKAFGFGQKTGISLLGEVGGISPSPSTWSKSSIINIPIGQGIAMTSIQLAAAVGAVANDGVLMQPRIISRIDDQDGKVIQDFETKIVTRVVSKETSIEARSVLEGVVSRGTGKKAAVPGFKAAGKTGTAQKLEANGAYSHDKFVASFVGFVPYDQPAVVIVVNINEPHPVIFGGDVAAPAFSRIASNILSYWKIAQQVTPKEVVSTRAQAITKKSPKKISTKLLNTPSQAVVGLPNQ